MNRIVLGGLAALLARHASSSRSGDRVRRREFDVYPIVSS